MSVDVVRGAAIAAMVLVNEPAVGPPYLYRQLTHASWNGATFADLVFPLFLFVVGVSMAWSLARYVDGRSPRHQATGRIARRVAILFVAGLALNAVPLVLAGAPVLAELRVMGVLQRIALAYAVAAFAVVWLRPRTQVLFVAVLLLGYWALLRWVPVPGHPAGSLTPGLNLPGWVDRRVLGASHLYQAGRAGHDPEGLLGTLPAAAGVVIGAWAGRLLRSGTSRATTATALNAAGVGALSLGIAWSAVLPINKRMWTPSFVALMSGIALVVLAGAHVAVDRPGVVARRVAFPLRVLGANALVVYAGSELTGSVLGVLSHRVPGIARAPFTYWVWWRWLEPTFGGRVGNVVWAAGVLGLWWLVAAAMWRRQWFIRA